MNVGAKLLVVGASCLAAFTLARAQDQAAAPRHITLQEAVQLALKHNHLVRIAGFQADEKQQAKGVARSQYLPTIDNDTRAFHVTDSQFIELAAGSLGTVGGTPIPEQSDIINQGGHTFVVSSTTLTEPLTQLFTKVKPANDIASAELGASRANALQTANEVALQVHQIYYRVLIAQLQRTAIESKIKAAQDLQGERTEQVKYGSTLEENLIESRAEFLQAKQQLLATELALTDLTSQLDDAIGLPLTTELDLDPSVPEVRDVCQLDDCIKTALASHPEIVAAREEVRKASAGVQLSKADYVPDIAAFARYSYQDNVPFLARNFGSFGVQFNYNLFDGGRKRDAVRESDAQLAQAKENLARVTDEVRLSVQVAYNKLQRTREMLGVSQELLDLRTESSRVSAQQLEKGAALQSQADAAAAQELDARTQLLQSQLDYLQASDEMTQAMGLTPQ